METRGPTRRNLKDPIVEKGGKLKGRLYVLGGKLKVLHTFPIFF